MIYLLLTLAAEYAFYCSFQAIHLEFFSRLILKVVAQQQYRMMVEPHQYLK
jgi:hypothetical protein